MNTDKETPVKNPCVDCKVGDVRHFEDVWITARIVEVDDHVIGFELFNIMSLTTDPKTYRYTPASSDVTTHVANLDKALVCAVGNVTWDGCSNLSVLVPEGHMQHFCAREQIAWLSTAMQRCYDWAEEVMPEFDDGSDND